MEKKLAKQTYKIKEIDIYTIDKYYALSGEIRAHKRNKNNEISTKEAQEMPVLAVFACGELLAFFTY